MSPETQVLQRAQAQGLLPADAHWPADEQRPWPVLLLTAIGAWFVALPMLAVIGSLFGGLLSDSVALLPVGAALIALAALPLRDRSLPLFVEQLAVPVLLVGLLCVGWFLHQMLDDRPANALLGLLCLGLSLPLPRSWLRLLLGAAAAACALLLSRPWSGLGLPSWIWTLALVLAWALLQRLPLPARLAEAWEAAGAGWLLVLIAGLAWQSGSPWLLTGLLGIQAGTRFAAPTFALSSLLCALAGLALLLRAWPSLRSPRWVLLAALPAPLALVLPALGPLALIAALCLRERRWRLAVAAGLAALWVLGSFYYLLAWSLADKALGLIALGALMGLVLRLGRTSAATAPRPQAGARAPLALVALLLTLLVANVGIWQKERLIAEGEPVFVALAPADPRSLMQGDYMTLAFALPREMLPPFETALGGNRPHLVLRLDERGVASFQRLDDGRPLAAGERRFELSPKDGSWVLVTDAWFFREGEAERWQAARFGEFRLMPDGRALLVNLRDAELKPL